MRSGALHRLQFETARGERDGAKRALDIIIAAGALVGLAPLLLLIACAIRAESHGPVFFRQLRGGRGGVPFRIVKFRTMALDAGDGPVHQARRGDPRITRIGAWLRRTNLDELPQLINVLRGEMSLVGPRPHAVDHDAAFGRWVKGYGARFAVRPGLTGLAQVNGHRGEIEMRSDLENRLADDLAYIATRSLRLDLRIMLLTLLPHRGFRNAH